MKKMIILNHKMNLEYDQTYEYIDKLNKIETNRTEFLGWIETGLTAG